MNAYYTPSYYYMCILYATLLHVIHLYGVVELSIKVLEDQLGLLEHLHDVSVQSSVQVLKDHLGLLDHLLE